MAKRKTELQPHSLLAAIAAAVPVMFTWDGKDAKELIGIFWRRK